MTTEDNNEPSLKCCCTYGALISLLKETFDHVQCLQRAIVVMCEGQHDFKAEYREDQTEVKRQLAELRRNKIWLPRQSV